MLLIKVMPINRVRSMWFCPQSAILLDGCLPKACGPDGCLVSTRGGSDYDLGLCLFYWILRRTCAELSPESRHKWQDHKSLSSHFSSFINVTVPCFLLSFLFFGHSDVSKFSCSTQWPIYLIKDEKIIGNIVFFLFLFFKWKIESPVGIRTAIGPLFFTKVFTVADMAKCGLCVINWCCGRLRYKPHSSDHNKSY